MIDLAEYTVNVARYAVELCVNYSWDDRVELFGFGNIKEIFRVYTVAHIRDVLRVEHNKGEDREVGEQE